MHPSTFTRTGRRSPQRVRARSGPRLGRRAMLAAALPLAAVAAVVPPAEAGYLGASGSALYYTGAPGEKNDVSVRLQGGELVIRDTARIQAMDPTCRVYNLVEAVCPATMSQVSIATFDGEDTVRYRAPHAGYVSLGDGTDQAFGGNREAAGRTIQPLVLQGGAGYDSISYAEAPSGVMLDTSDNEADDGRAGIDRENVGSDFEGLKGSPFGDTLWGSDAHNIIEGGNGRDMLAGGHGQDVFISTFKDGADDYHGGPDRDGIMYLRSEPLEVWLDNVAADGEAGEHDNVRSNVENVHGGSAADKLYSLGAHSHLYGLGGDDLLMGGGGPDRLDGGPGQDRLYGESGADVLEAKDGERDRIDCGLDRDTLRRDSSETSVAGCEVVTFP